MKSNNILFGVLGLLAGGILTLGSAFIFTVPYGEAIDRIYFIQHGVERQASSFARTPNTDEGDKAETLESPTETVVPEATSEATTEAPSTSYRTESKDLSYKLAGSTLKIFFNVFAEGWPTLEDGENYFFTSTAEMEGTRAQLNASKKYSPESIEGYVESRSILQFLSEEAPEVGRFEIKGSVLTIYFKSAPRELFQFKGVSDGEIEWEGIYILPESEE